MIRKPDKGFGIDYELKLFQYKQILYALCKNKNTVNLFNSTFIAF